MKTIRTLGISAVALLWMQLGWSEELVTATATPTPEVAPAATAEAQAAAPAAADTAAVDTAAMLKEDHPESYMVVKGDTLWHISNRFLKNPWMWPEIWHVNPQIANPHLIYPGDTVKLIYLEGGPKLTVRRGEAGVTYKLSPSDPGAAVSGSATADMSVGQDGKLTPAVRSLPLEEPIPAIPLDIIDPFLSGNRIVTASAFKDAPYVVHGSQGHVISGSGSELYARGDFEDDRVVYGFFRKGKVYTDPKSGEVLGIQAIDIGTGKIKSKERDVGRFTVTRANQEVRIGDYLLVDQERRVDSTFFPSAPKKEIQAEILDVAGGVTQVGPMSVVLVNKGEREGLKSGNILAIFQRGEVARDPITDEDIRLPDERAGLLMVFAPFEKISYALVLYADRPLAVGDMLRKP